MNGSRTQLHPDFTTRSDGSVQAAVTIPALPKGGTVDWFISGKFVKRSKKERDEVNQAQMFVLDPSPPTSIPSLTNALELTVLLPLKIKNLIAENAQVAGSLATPSFVPKKLGTSATKFARDARTRPNVIAALSKPKRVEIALRRLSGNGAHSCLWLSNRRATFRRTRRINGRCTPIWLRAPGKRGTPKWSLRFLVPLPRGRYGVEARVVDVAGIKSDPARAQVFFTVR